MEMNERAWRAREDGPGHEPGDAAVALFAQSHVPEILAELWKGEVGFRELQKRTRTSSNTLKRRLWELEACRIARKRSVLRRRGTGYILTSDGLELASHGARLGLLRLEWDGPADAVHTT